MISMTVNGRRQRQGDRLAPPHSASVDHGDLRPWHGVRRRRRGRTGYHRSAFAVPNLRCENGPAAALARIGWYRSVINIPHAFAIWSFVDELAHAAGKDPKEFLLELLGPDRIIDMTNAGLTSKPWNYDRSLDDYPIDTARYRKVAELVAEKSGWGKPLPSGRGRGIAVHRSFLSYVATVMEVEVKSDGGVTIPES
jgi:isoquinoline 1-oxidoreductase beta subunit